MNLSFFIVSCMLNTFNKSKYELPLFISFKKYKQKYPHVVVFIFESDYFGEVKLNSLFSHDSPILETEVHQSCQNN